MRIVYYGTGRLTYDLSAICKNCAYRHVARYDKGQSRNDGAACPHCGVGKTLVYGPSVVAAAWLEEDSAGRTCAACGGPLAADENSRDYCEACWQRSLTHALGTAEAQTA